MNNDLIVNVDESYSIKLDTHINSTWCSQQRPNTIVREWHVNGKRFIVDKRLPPQQSAGKIFRLFYCYNNQKSDTLLNEFSPRATIYPTQLILRYESHFGD